MFKKLISYAIIFSFFYQDLAFCMDDSKDEGTGKDVQGRRLSGKKIENPALSSVMQENKNLKPPLTTPSETNSINLSSHRISDETQQDPSLSPPSNNSSPRSTDSSKNSSSMGGHDSTHFSSESSENRLTQSQSSEEEHRNSPRIGTENKENAQNPTFPTQNSSALLNETLKSPPELKKGSLQSAASQIQILIHESNNKKNEQQVEKTQEPIITTIPKTDSASLTQDSKKNSNSTFSKDIEEGDVFKIQNDNEEWFSGSWDTSRNKLHPDDSSSEELNQFLSLFSQKKRKNFNKKENLRSRNSSETDSESDIDFSRRLTLSDPLTSNGSYIVDYGTSSDSAKNADSKIKLEKKLALKEEKDSTAKKNTSVNSIELLDLEPANEVKNTHLNIQDNDDSHEDGLSPAVRAFLLHANYLIEGKPTWQQILIGGLGGTLIGVGVGNAMPPIFERSLETLGDAYLGIITSSDLTTNLFISHTAISLGIDSIVRNMDILGKLASPSLEKFSVPKNERVKNIRRALLSMTYGGVAIAGFLPVYYLWDAEGEYIKERPEYRHNTLIFFSCLAPTLWLDSLLVTSNAVKSWIDDKINDHCIRAAYSDPLSKGYNLRQQELNRFQDLASLFAAMNDEGIQAAYNTVYTKQPHATKSRVSLSEEQIKIFDAIHTLKALRQIHKGADNNSIILEDPENCRTTTSTLLSWGIPLAASVGRSLVFWYVIDDMLNSLGMPLGAARQFLAIGGGELLAAAFQGKIELDTVKKAVSDLLFTSEEKESSHNPWWKTGRILSKGYTYLQGAWNTLPYMLVGGKATRFWPTWARVATLLPFGLADMCNNSICFQESYGDVFGTIESVAAHAGKVTPGYMRKTLLNLTKKFQNLYHTLHPNVVISIETVLLDEGKSIHD